jgi:hypothetical protein
MSAIADSAASRLSSGFHASLVPKASTTIAGSSSAYSVAALTMTLGIFDLPATRS